MLNLLSICFRVPHKQKYCQIEVSCNLFGEWDIETKNSQQISQRKGKQHFGLSKEQAQNAVQDFIRNALSKKNSDRPEFKHLKVFRDENIFHWVPFDCCPIQSLHHIATIY